MIGRFFGGEGGKKQDNLKKIKEKEEAFKSRLKEIKQYEDDFPKARELVDRLCAVSREGQAPIMDSVIKSWIKNYRSEAEHGPVALATTFEEYVREQLNILTREPNDRSVSTTVGVRAATQANIGRSPAEENWADPEGDALRAEAEKQARLAWLKALSPKKKAE